MKQLLHIYSLFAVLPLLACGIHEDHEKEKEHLSLAVTKPVIEEAKLNREFVCQIRAVQHIELRALARGYIDTIHVDEGQTVTAGQPMFEIMPMRYQAELDQAKAEADSAEIKYRNTEKLASEKVVATSELDLARAKLNQAEAKLAKAQVELNFTRILAPFSGIMGRLEVRKGSLVENGDLLTTLSDNHEMWVYFNVPEAVYLSNVKSADDVRQRQLQLVMADGSVYNHTGKITAVEADFNNETGNIAYRATFPNPDGLLRHGQTGKILLDASLKDAMIIPQASVYEVMDKKFVMTVDDKGTVTSKEIRVAEQMPNLFVVSDGLSANDNVLLEGQRKVNDGDIITPKFKEPKQVMAKLSVYAE